MRRQVSEVIAEHWPQQSANEAVVFEVECMGCDWTGRHYGDHAEHVAEVLHLAGLTIS